MTQYSDGELLSLVPQGHVRAVSQLISLAENEPRRAQRILRALSKPSPAAQVIGVTGAPGAGKSTLIDRLASCLKTTAKKVAILAVDPSSPFSGGAILGDRIRMDQAAAEGDIFVRSMASRGSLGGLSRGVFDAVQVLKAAGFEYVLLETVGVGQAEVEVVRIADTCLVLLVPGMGDAIQTFKAGIMEIADIFVINKADRPGADAVECDLRFLISFACYADEAWKPRINRTVATSGEGCEKLAQDIEAHWKWLAASSGGAKRKLRIMEETLLKIAGETIYRVMLEKSQDKLTELADCCLKGVLNPYVAMEELIATVTS